MTRVWDVPVHDATRVRDARVAVEEAAELVGLGERRSASAALVATELATNLLKHGGGGRMLIELAPHPAADRDRGAEAPEAAVQILAIDHGDGIPSLADAMQDGFSSTDSLGAGLGTCRRTSDVFDIHSARGRGTVVLARIARPVPEYLSVEPPAPILGRIGGVHVPVAGMQESGDAWTCWSSPGRRTLMVVDGLGHGPEAAEAGDAAVRRFHRSPDLPLEALLREIDTALHGTRGAAIAIARIDPWAGRLDYAGIGNIAARLRTGGQWQHLLSKPGIVGAHRTVAAPPARHPWTADGLLVMHSDGLPNRWQYSGDADGELHRHDPALISAVLLRDASSPASTNRDDTTIAIATADGDPWQERS
ncbi:ATP-binding SpoIIE family protein phosphatase [Nocardiopsis ansamitocini]|uniref:PPM-type phosphatase domain-containing protein n=1 Tax=Nocardiopsis ansamitocini TaxID=1670832 RepID=A0A9W6UKA0_9ACTN|nr:ATP-binding SpoIIE family protein phosphatase [Nocardiopsis ansamitocini]GLU49517.1 hypothetical protein Nans01_38680 [Nocardiopsis ansamitocini]